MKINVEVDLTPEEARRAMGLPDMTPVHDIYLDKIKKTIEDGITPDTIKTMIQTWSPMSDAGFAMWRQLLTQMTSGGFNSGSGTADK